MAWSWGDGFDCYAAAADAINGYWDSGTIGASSFPTGRFSGSRALLIGNGNSLVKSSSVNDQLHHIVCALQQTSALTGSTLGQYFELFDGTTAQCSVVFRQDGAILLTAGAPNGTVLATYSGALTAINTWYAFEFEVLISNTAGYMKVRKNGNTTEDFTSALNLDTQASANAYANKLQAGNFAGLGHPCDDLFWRSDASSVAWLGDIRCYTRMPASDASVQFSHVPTSASVSQTAAQASTLSKASGAGIMSAFTAAYTGTISSGAISLNTGGTGNMKAAIYDATRTVVLATSNAVVNPVNGSNTITFGTPLAVIKGTVYHLAVDQDTTLIYNSTGASQWQFSTAYVSFPAASPSLSASGGPVFTVNISTSLNYETVSEPQQDATTSYAYDSTPGHTDLYSIAATATTPATVIAVTTRGYMQKSDAGTRTAAVQLKSGATTVVSPTLTLSSSGWLWTWRIDTIDPATGAAWTNTAVNNVQIGPVTVA